MPHINLLPPELQARQRTRRLLMVFTAAALIVMLFLALVVVIQRSTISGEEEELALLQAQRTELQQQVAALAQFGELKASVDRNRAFLQTALEGDVAWAKLLNDISLIIPSNSWVTSLSLAAAGGQAPSGEPSFGTASFQGFVFDFPGLAGWLTRMAQIEGLTFVYLTNGTRTTLEGREVVNFGANSNLTDALLSGRCQGEGAPCP